jgi:hypothetical protein
MKSGPVPPIGRFVTIDYCLPRELIRLGRRHPKLKNRAKLRPPHSTFAKTLKFISGLCTRFKGPISISNNTPIMQVLLDISQRSYTTRRNFDGLSERERAATAGISVRARLC